MVSVGEARAELPLVRRAPVAALALATAILALEAVGVGAQAVEPTVGYVATGAVRQAHRHVRSRLAPARELARRDRAGTLVRVVGGLLRRARRGGRAGLGRGGEGRRRRCGGARQERAIQAHGGIGFTWEHVLHRLYKRALDPVAWEASPRSLSQVAGHLLDRGGRMQGLIWTTSSTSWQSCAARRALRRSRDRPAAPRQELASLRVR